MNQRPKKGMNVDSMYWMRNLNPLFMMHPFSFLFSFYWAKTLLLLISEILGSSCYIPIFRC